MTAAAIGLFLAILVGSCLQRISGMGVGLIAAPILSLLIGPVEGVLVVNVLATANAALTTLTVRDRVDWSKFASIAPYLVLGAVPGAFLIRAVSTDVLLVIVGVILLIALSVVTLGKRFVPVVEGRVPAAVSGVIGGFMNTLAGVAGPAITVYSQAARWDQRTYAATLQPIFMVGGAVSFAMKELTGAADLAAVDPVLWVSGGIAMAGGIFLGVRISPHVPSVKAHAIALTLAVLGGVTALVRGGAGML
ncbi:sulfite exporter TauE/SafE family protein [Corynebacterium sanguinis]|uniref:sulfite exporter TauE/SafE family protein n=1 Tax=Corynebacterium sanguinis TaxID=2594913 RepID=UPI00223C10DC|nr:sulfite exporter TauE/SafE family protein [Corynebacterium sanguinis]MCT1696026.1 sulfite exporter TauE/SafE family protein [Corynebacterium sanguinis]MCT1715431.1 sulfite exporter TauE/SafE family protein [Corynebacterium sanguinis]